MSKTVVYTCLCCVFVLEVIALCKGVNGKALALSIGVFGTVLGYWIHILKSKHNKGG